MTADSAQSHGSDSLETLNGLQSLSARADTRTLAALPFPSSCPNVTKMQFDTGIADGWKITKIKGGLKTPRQVVVDSLGNLLVVEQGVGITALTFDGQGCINSTARVEKNTALNHGLDLSPDGKTLYASSLTTVWRWDYDAAARTVSNRTVVVGGMENGGHQTRALWVVPQAPQTLVVQVGSNANWDYASVNASTGRALMKGFDLGRAPAGGYNYVRDGYTLGYGQRNGVGVAFDPAGHAWEVENSADDVTRTFNGQAADVHIDNPAEELNYIGDPTKPNDQWYGYPYCVAAWDASVLRGPAPLKTGDQFVVSPSDTWNDANCSALATPPRLTFQAHSAPISALFDAAGETLYVTLHGSWDRQPATGYKLVAVPFRKTADGRLYEPVAPPDSRDGYADLFWNKNVGACSGRTCLRPTGLAWDRAHSRLFVLSDAAAEGEVFILAKTTWG